MGEVQTINIGPRNWQEHCAMLFVLIERGDSKGNAMAKTEILRMAELADLYVASVKAGKLVETL